MRLIDADELIKGFDMCIDTADDTASVLIASTFKRIVNNRPTIGLKTGHWIFIGDGYKCSECRSVYSWWADSQTSNFCPNCGADMREGEADG